MHRAMLIEMPIKIRAYDIDAVGIVSNIVYIRWFEDLRHEFLDKYYPFESMILEGKSPLLMKTEVEYLSPLTIHDKPTGRLWADKFGKTKWNLALEILCGTTIKCKGKQTGCFFSLESGRPTPFPDWFLQTYKDQRKS